MKKHWWETSLDYYKRIEQNLYKWFEKFDKNYYCVHYRVQEIFNIFNKVYPGNSNIVIFLENYIPFTIFFLDYPEEDHINYLETKSKELLNLGIVSLIIVKEESDARYAGIKSAVLIPYYTFFDFITEHKHTNVEKNLEHKRYIFEDKIKEFYKQKIENKAQK